MAVTHPTATRNGIADYVVDSLDSGAGSPSNGTLQMQTAGSVEVATLQFGVPAFGAASGGTATANAITSDTNADGGTVTKAILRNSSATTIISCSVTATGGGGDIEISSTAVGAGDTVSMSSLTYSAPA